MARQCLASLPLHAPDLREEVDQYTPIRIMPPGRAFVINLQPQNYVNGMVDAPSVLLGCGHCLLCPQTECADT